MAYEVRMAESFRVELLETLDYLTEELDSPGAAQNVTRRVGEVLRELEAMPESFPYVREGYLRLREYRKATVGNYLVLYRIAEYRAVIEGGSPVEHGEVGGIEGVVHVTHLFHASQEWTDLV